MDEIYYKYCDKVEDIQKDIDEIDKYIKSINNLKNSKFNKQPIEAMITDLANELLNKKIKLQASWQVAYNNLLSEADCLVESSDYSYLD